MSATGSGRVRPPSPAAAELARAGYSLSDVARPLGITPGLVGLQLAGRRPLQGYVIEALEGELGPDAADRVLALVPGREATTETHLTAT